MWGEEDVLDNTRVPLFAGSLLQGLFLWAEWEILGKPQPKQNLAWTSSSPQNFSPPVTLSWFWPQGPCEAEFPAALTQLRGQCPSSDEP